MSKFHFISGFFKHLFNPRISILAFVSSNNTVDPKARIYRGVKIKGSKVGAYTYICPNTDVENAEIGKFCSISDHCRIGMGKHNLGQLSTSPLFTEKRNGTGFQWVPMDTAAAGREKVYVGNDVLIGSHALILGGVKISDGAVIGAGAVVTSDVPPYAVVGGVPAKLIRYRFGQDVISRLQTLRWWDWSEEKLKKNIGMFQRNGLELDDLNNI